MVTRKTRTAALAEALPKTKRCTPTSTSLRRHSALISTDGGCTRPGCTGRPRTRLAVNHSSCSTLQSSGRRQRRLSTQGPSASRVALGRGSSANSIPTQSGGSKPTPSTTSLLMVLNSPHKGGSCRRIPIDHLPRGLVPFDWLIALKSAKFAQPI